MKKMKKKLLRIAEMVDGWAKRGGVDELERDLVLGILQDVYFEIKYAKAKQGKRAEKEAAGKPDPLWWNMKTVAEEPAVAGVEELVAAGIAVEYVVSEETPVMPRRVDPDVIRSLYGEAGSEEKDEDEDKAPEVVEENPKKSPEVAKKVAEKPEKTAATPPASSAGPTPPIPPASPAPAATLGDAMGVGRQTLGEVLRGGEKDTAAKIAAADHPSLKKSIGLNDRFLMIRDLFDGDGAEFDSAIERLDGFTDLDEAIIHIHDTYDWSADNEAAILLVELLERKLD